jgi:3-isopropylmalate/(R)-2-methylmalate dehydratase small subunit
MEFEINSKVWVFGDNIDTDVILPGPYLTIHDAEGLGEHAMEGIDPDFAKKVSSGDIIIAGRNFGCGSSREHAPLALKGAGVAAVIAESFSRIFFRNAINIGLPILECPGIKQSSVEEGDLFFVDFRKGILRNVSKEQEYSATGLPNFIIDIIIKGGIVPYYREKFEKEKKTIG